MSSPLPEHQRPEGVDDLTVSGLGKVSEALEAIEIARGHLYTFHRLSGTAEVVTDRRELDAVWAASALLRQFLGTIADPEFVLYRIVPSRIRYMQEWALAYHEVDVA